MNQPPFRNQRMHPNSLEAYRDLDLSPRCRAIFEIYVAKHPKALTDRQVLYYLTGSYTGENKVQPRISDMIKHPDIPLVEYGRTKSKTTGKTVRVVGLAPIEPDHIKVPRAPVPDLTHADRKIMQLYPPGSQISII